MKMHLILFNRVIGVRRILLASSLISIIFVFWFYKANVEVNMTLKNSDEKKVSLKRLLLGSIKSAQKGGLEILAVSRSNNVNIKKKHIHLEGSNELVTDADFRSHCAITKELQKIYPELTIISEEDRKFEECQNESYFDDFMVYGESELPDEFVDLRDIAIWVDPLDATQEYTERLFNFVTTMVCVAVKGVPTIGVIHNPFTKQTTWAWIGKAMSENLRAIIRKNSTLENPVITISRSHAGTVKDMAIQAFGKNTQILIAAGAGFKVMQLISNNATVYLHTTRIKKWDICAADAILNAVGGKMTNLLNERLEYSKTSSPINENGILSTLNNHDSFIKKIIKYKSAI